jgi:hypothetical protein
MPQGDSRLLAIRRTKTHTNYKGEFNGKRSSFEKDGGSD